MQGTKRRPKIAATFFDQATLLANRLDTIERDVADLMRKWRLVTGETGTGELDEQAFYFDVLTNLFSDDDLIELCFDLGIDYELLSGSSKIGKSAAMMKWAKNNNKSRRLYELIKEKRPFIFDEDGD